MKKFFLLIFLALAGVLTYYLWYSKKNKPVDETPRLQPLAVSQHTDVFNASARKAMESYYNLSESFVNWDSAGIRANATALKANIAVIQFDELKKDTAIYQTAVSYIETLNNDLNIIIKEKNLETSRKAFHSFSQNLYDFLRTVRYDESTIYLQECSMAFNETEPGIWLSKTSVIRNPYLGVQHPKYKSGMLKCGETKDSLDFMTSAGAKK